MNPNSWVMLRSLMSRPAFQALVARMILWVQSSNHPRPTFISLDTPAASARRAARFGHGTHLLLVFPRAYKTRHPASLADNTYPNARAMRPRLAPFPSR